MTGKPDVLIINSYAGSITIGVSQARFDIRGSYEDCGFGQEVQRANFPKLEYRPTTADWPRQDLSASIVMAHPPCSAFSLMTPRWMQKDDKKLVGTDSGAFQCTVKVMDYAFKNKALALCVESVPGALEGARGIHDKFAKKHGYDVFRIMQNACTFGNPQWRPRFWAVFVRQGVLGEGLELSHQPTLTPVGSIVQETGEVIERDVEAFERQRKRLTDHFGRSFANKALTGQLGYGTMVALVTKKLKEMGTLEQVRIPRTKMGIDVAPGSQGAVTRAYCERAPYVTNVLRIMNPDELAPTVLAGAWWTIGGLDRPLFRDEYKRIMGFPADYAFPGATLSQFRMYLSKGVVPSVAKWLVEQVSANLMDKVKSRSVTHVCQPGEIVNLCPPSRSQFVAPASEAA